MEYLPNEILIDIIEKSEPKNFRELCDLIFNFGLCNRDIFSDFKSLFEYVDKNVYNDIEGVFRRIIENKNGDLFNLKRITKIFNITDRRYGEEVLVYAVDRGDLNMLNWIHERFRISDAYVNSFCEDGSLYSWACQSGYLNILKWLHENFGLDKTIFVNYIFTDASEFGHLDILKWLHKNFDIIEYTEAFNKASENGHLHVLEWLSKISYTNLYIINM